MVANSASEDTSPTSSTPSVGRRIAGILLVLIGLLFSIALSLGVFIGTAAATSELSVMLVLGMLTLLLAAVLFVQPGLRRLGVTRSRGVAALLAILMALVVGLSAAMIVASPFPITAPGPVPDDVQFWDLPTGSRIAYVTLPAQGEARPPPVIVLHGGPGTPGEGLPPAAEAMAAAGFDVYAYDQVGAGRSTRLSDVTQYTVARQVADLDAIRETIGAEQVILVGRSWGATLTAAYIAAHPDRVSKAVLVSPGELWGGASPEDSSSALASHLTPEQEAQVDELTSGPRILLQAVLQGVNPNAAHAFMPDDEADSFMRSILLAQIDATTCTPGTAEPHGNLPGFYVNQLTSADAKAVPDPRPTLREVTIPVLILRGDCDYLAWAVADEFRQTFSNATLLLIENAGHSIPADQPALYEDVLIAFLADQPLPLPAYTAEAPSV